MTLHWIYRIGVVLLSAGLLAACGGGDEGGDAGGGDQANGASGQATTAEVADASKAKRKCPPKVTTGQRAEGAPVDDIAGIRIGMSFDDVTWVLECRGDVPLIETAAKWNIQQDYGFPIRQLVRATDGVPCTSQEILADMRSMGDGKCDNGGYSFKSLKDIGQQFAIVFTGMPGDEVAGAVWRRNGFTQGENPTVESLSQSLAQKYGAPHDTETDRRGVTTLTWQYDLLGRPMSKATPAYRSCAQSFNPNFNAGQRWSSSCGLSLKAAITPVPGNELLAKQLDVGVMHQKQFYDAGQQFEAALAAANEQRKREQAEEAASQGAAPDL
ncbi:MAG: hypothetical protein Tsb0016_10740 [Sphingomonadales bacterium]